MTVYHPSASQLKRQNSILIGFILAILALVGIGCALVIWRGNLPYMTLRSVPILPGADITMDGRESDWLKYYLADGGPQAEIFYSINRPWPEVVAFYKTEMGKQNWKLEKEDSMEFTDMLSGDHDHDVCLVFRRAPVFLANVDVIGVVKGNNALAKTSVTVNSAPNGNGFCE